MRRSGKATGPWVLSAVLLVPGALPALRPGDPPPDGGQAATGQGLSDDLPDTEAPTIACAAPDALWHAANVLVHCTATDPGGLAKPADAAFDLVTTVEKGAENASAATGTRQVCDIAGNCANAGPVAGNKVDRKAPKIDIRVPAENASYGLFTAQNVNFECLDGGSGIAECKGDQDEGARLKTGASTLGDHTFTIIAVDAVGNERKTVRKYKVEPVVMPAAQSPDAPPADKPPANKPPAIGLPQVGKSQKPPAKKPPVKTTKTQKAPPPAQKPPKG